MGTESELTLVPKKSISIIRHGWKLSMISGSVFRSPFEGSNSFKSVKNRIFLHLGNIVLTLVTWTEKFNTYLAVQTPI